MKRTKQSKKQVRHRPQLLEPSFGEDPHVWTLLLDPLRVPFRVAGDFQVTHVWQPFARQPAEPEKRTKLQC